MRVATDFDQTDGQHLGGKIGLSVDVLRISKSNTAMHCSLQVVLKGKDDTQGRNEFPQHTHIKDILVTLASENFHRGWADNSHLPCDQQLGLDNIFASNIKAFIPSHFSLCSGQYLVLK